MKNIKIGHQSPKNLKQNDRFNHVSIEGDFAYCKSHNFVFQPEKEEELLYHAKPCYYTDSRFKDGTFNSYKRAYLLFTPKTNHSLKSCIRRILKCRNIPLNTIVDITTNWYYTNKKVDTSYLFKVKRENTFNIQYEVNLPEYEANFTSCKFSQELTNKLREKGFLVQVFPNSNFINNLVNNAAAITGIGNIIDSEEEGEIAIAYGYGRKIGFSSYNHSLYGYSSGAKYILWDRYGEFTKWRDSNQIPKTESIDAIVAKIKNTEAPEFV